MFEYDATLMQIKDITTENITFGNFQVFNSISGQCMIMDTLTNPVNFYDTTQIALCFEISFNGVGQGVGMLRFISDSCYFKTEEEENINAVYQDTLNVNVHPGFIEMTLAQIGWGCSYETKGRAEVTVIDGAPPYKYEWSEGTQQAPSWNQAGQLPEGEVDIRVIDVNGCLHDTLIMIETLRAPEIDWSYETARSLASEFAVKEHPIHFMVTEFGKNGNLGINWYWELYYTDPTNLDSLKNLWEDGKRDQTDFNYVFHEDGDYEVRLSAQHQTTGCDTTVIKSIKVAPAQLNYKNLVTPGNNRFKITANENQKLRDVFVSHVLIVQDRTGRKVYETKDFPDDGWDGGGCPNGTYYFILKGKSTRKEYRYQGTVVILGGNK
jgi:hypothetical protein